MILTKWLSAFAGILYIILGVFVIMKEWFIFPLEQFVAYGLGALLIAYGIFRIVRVFVRTKRNPDEI